MIWLHLDPGYVFTVTQITEEEITLNNTAGITILLEKARMPRDFPTDLKLGDKCDFHLGDEGMP